MASLKFYGSDLMTYSFTASAGSHASFPLTNLKSYFADERWRSGGTSDQQTLIIDFGSAKARNFWAIDQHNWQTAMNGQDPGVRLQVGTTDDGNFASPIHVDEWPLLLQQGVREFSTQTKRYWRLLFDNGQTLAAAPELGQIFIDARFDFGFEYDIPWRFNDSEFRTLRRIALDGRIRTVQQFGGRRTASLKLSALDAAKRTEFQSWIKDIARGSGRPFYILDADGTTLLYAHLDDDLIPAIGADAGMWNIERIQLSAQMIS